VVEDAFAVNLRHLCSSQPSISQVCRDIGLNRQQFNKYLAGNSRPSAYNLRRICAHFGVSERDLLRPPAEFLETAASTGSRSGNAWQAFRAMFPGDLRGLRALTGDYHCFYRSPSWGGRVICALTRLIERDGYMQVRTLEIVSDPARGIRQLSKCGGFASLLNGLVFISECDRLGADYFAHSVLSPPSRHQRRYLRGIMSGVAWRPERHPYASRVMWRRLDPRVSLREALSACGALRLDQLRRDPIVHGCFSETAAVTAEGLLQAEEG